MLKRIKKYQRILKIIKILRKKDQNVQKILKFGKYIENQINSNFYIPKNSKEESECFKVTKTN